VLLLYVVGIGGDESVAGASGGVPKKD